MAHGLPVRLVVAGLELVARARRDIVVAYAWEVETQEVGRSVWSVRCLSNFYADCLVMEVPELVPRIMSSPR